MANYPQNYPGAWAEHNAGRGVQYNSTPQPQIGPQDGGQHYRVSQNEEFRSPPRPDRETSNMAGQRVNRPGQYDRSPSPKNRNRSARGEGGYRNDGMWRGGPQSPQSDSSFGSPQSNYYQNRWRDNERKVYESSPSYQRNSRWDHNNSPRNYHSDSSQSSGSGRHRDRDPDVHLSKKLSFLLRHGAEKSGFTLMSGGFLYVEDILKLPELQEFSLKDVRRIVENNDKQRFALQPNPENKKMMIRANQGHTMQVQNLDLKPITSAEEAQEVIHGTYYKSWEIIKHSGLSRMGRNHIHFAAGEPGENGVISGMRSSCEVVIRIDMEKALNDGLKFFRSANNVILCAGDKDGIIYPAYFDVVIQRHPRMMIHFDKCVTKANAQEVPSKSKKSKKTKKREREEDSEGGKKKTGRQEKKKEEKNEDQSDSIEYDLQNDFLEGSNSKEAACEEKRKKTDTPAVDEKINKAVDEIPNQPVAEEANQPEDVTDAWDDGQQEAESDVLVEEEYTTTKIDDADISKCTLKEICDRYVWYRRHHGYARGSFLNNGHSCAFSTHNGDVRTYGKVLRNVPGQEGADYVFSELHFHIGANGSRSGSEHRINGKGFRGEIHMVHWKKTEELRTYEKGSEATDGLVAIGIFFNVVRRCHTEADRLILKYVYHARRYEAVKDPAFANPSLLLPADGMFYTYKGSKTTPPCNTNIIWIVYNTPTTICHRSYRILMALQSAEIGHPFLRTFGNDRPIQSKGTNNVQANFLRCD